MTSMLMNCPQCSVMIPIGGPCEDCRWSDRGEEEQQQDLQVAREYARRRGLHKRNFAIFMVLSFAAGLMGLMTAYMWIRTIYLGDVVAFVLIGFFTVASGVMGVMVALSKKLFPVELNCPACNIRLDELGMEVDYCPGCSATLR